VSHIPRLNKVINVIARYRLDDYLKGQPSAPWVRLLLIPHRLFFWFGSKPKGNKSVRLRMALEELGPIYIKFGQLLSTRRDFLDAELADELQSLQDNVPPFTTPSIESIVEQSLEMPVSEVFSQLDSQPLASASVAQVHKATLINGDEVVIKVIRPGIEETINDDLKLLKWLAQLLENYSDIGRRLRPIEVVNDYETIIVDELNLQAEGANTAQLRKNFENSSSLYVPKIYWDYSRRNMLVMERIHGIPVTRIEELQANNINLQNLAETGVQIFFTQVFEHNFFHADMHPGNIFVARDKTNQPQYIAIDCAIMGSLSHDDQEYLARNLLAIFKRDYRKVAELHIACGWVPAHTKVHEFESAMRTVCEPIFEKPLKEISFGHLLVQLFRTAGRFDMEVQPSLVLLQKTLLNIEGLGRQLYPDLDLWETALPYLENWNRKRLNPFTLISRVQENIPDWIDQLPELPQLVINAIARSEEVEQLNQQLAQLREEEAARDRARLKRNRLGGIMLLGLAILSLYPPVSELISAMPVTTLAVAAGGVYLLCFRR